MNFFKLTLFIAVSLSFYCASAVNFIHVNQLGYYAGSKKIALVSEMDAESFSVRLASTNQVVFSDRLAEPHMWTMSGENLQFADFSSFKTPGRYYLQIGTERSNTFSIGDTAVYDTLAVWAAKAFYLWRASCPIESQFAVFKGTDYSRELGHPDTVVYVHRSLF